MASASAASSMPAVGILSEDLANNIEGYVDAFGIASKLNTSAFDFGDTLYVAPSGGLTNVTHMHSHMHAHIHTHTHTHRNKKSITYIKISITLSPIYIIFICINIVHVEETIGWMNTTSHHTLICT